MIDFLKRRRNTRCAPRGASQRGFTLLELMIVMAIIIILVTLGVGRYQQAIERAREAALHQDLTEMRKAIQNYTLDKSAAPNSLDDLVQAKYLASIPSDPITHGTDWNVSDCDELLSADQTSTGICDVHSTSDAISPFENTPYNSW
jgi:general secretion pathway protein G